ncbi:MAG TPA: TonB-dependent siderophore receptor [Xanthomonadaceae bacterium]|nr:TonB-dependent siderophore receptor [Xanthomonadaceae bacterium]
MSASGRSRALARPAFRCTRSTLSVPLFAALAATIGAAQAEEADAPAATMDTVHVTAEQIAKQALGTSIITREDIERRPPANDLADILRTMPGVNLTGNSASGAYGNNRQIDLRGMGPENTLILVDGRRVSSRDSVRMGVAGERNSRGDTNWVPAEAVERIEVLRGPAAARYGSGAAGGVINIITRKPTGDLAGSMTMYGLVPEHGDEGGSQRAGFTLSGPLARDWSFRVYGNLNKTDADAADINAGHSNGATPAAGREGVRNKDVKGLLRWDPSASQTVELESGFSRQGNIFAGEYLNTSNATVQDKIGAETNVMIRRDAAITHRGKWDFGTSRLTFSYGDTDNTRLSEGLAGGPEGSLAAAPVWTRSNLKDYSADGELNLPSVIGGIDHIWTLGFEYRDSGLDDPYSMSQSGTGVGGIDAGTRSGKTDEQVTALFVEDNIYLGERLTLTPGLRFDHHSQFGDNLGPSLNAQFKLAEDWLVKGGIARAFKAPNLYQANPNYLYYTRGNGCPDYYTGSGGCYIQGNADLDSETSINKEIGVEWLPDNGYHASLTYFHNDYDDKIVAGYSDYYETAGSAYVYQWVNASKALVQGLEGNFRMPLLGERGRTLSWNTNLTWMLDNKNEQTGQPLSVIPEYTFNTALDWRPTEQLSFSLMATFYGRQEQATRDRNNEPVCGTADLGPCDTLGAYSLWSASGRYRITDAISLGFGVNNLADKRVFREGSRASSAGAATYNEPGRAYWTSLTLGF